MKIVRPAEDDINDVLNECSEAADSGTSKFPGMTYEQGVEAAIRWMLGDDDTNPMAD
jgi:hypothetical protein